MRTLPRWILYPIVILLSSVLIGAAMIAVVLSLTYPRLPSLDIIIDYRPKIPLRVFTADGYLIGEFGEERRDFVRITEVPDIMKQAIIAAEDERFYQHGGVDAVGVLRATLNNLLSGGKKQGASTITQQVAKNFFLSSERTYVRKLYEALLAFKIESNLSKDQILELYINQIYLGQRAYGFAAASQVYYGKPLAEVNIAEAAMLAGLPKAPSMFNPVVNPLRARQRQQYVLRKMLELQFIDKAKHDEALAETLVVKREFTEFPVRAEHVAEMARLIAAESFPDDVYTRGLRVYTTILKSDQDAAYSALRRNVLDYDRRHAYRGAEAYLDMSKIKSNEDEALEDLLDDYTNFPDLSVAVVLEASPKQILAYRKGGELIKITGDGLRLVARFLDTKAPANKRVQRGAVIRVFTDDKNNWRVTQTPEVEAAFVSLDPKTGAIRSLVGSFDFEHNKFNHVTQAWRQPGSSFKPFVYSASLEKGFTPASIIDDEPISIPALSTGGRVWEPKNYDGKYEGPMSMRLALAKSKNMVSIRLLQASGPVFVQDYVTRFGFDADKHQPFLTMALGAGSVTPWQMVSAYAVFANGGYRIKPFVVREIRDEKNQVVAQANPVNSGEESLRVIDPRNAFLMDSMMRDVTIYGTAGRASALLKRRDLAGKTGTTNEHVDAWFCGYQRTVAACSWIGFDQPKNLGGGETGGTAALPAWISYMSKALKDVPESTMSAPKGLASVETPGTGKKELIYQENVPITPPEEPSPQEGQAEGSGSVEEPKE